MARTWRDVSAGELEGLLASAAVAVDFPDAPDVASMVAGRLRAEPSLRRRPVIDRASLGRVFRPAWPRVAVAAAMVAVLCSGTLVFSPAARHAVAGWLGLRGVKIQAAPSGTPTPSPSPSPTVALGAGLDLGQRVTLAEAQAAVPFQILIPSDPRLGPPDEIYLRQGLIANQVTLLYRSRPGLPPSAFSGAGLLLTEFQARIDEEFVLTKTVYLGSTVDRVTVNGEPGFWISGRPHEVAYIDEVGGQLIDRTRLAGNVLLWQLGDVTLRIEADIERGEAIAFASSVS